MNWLSIIPLLISAADVIKKIVDISQSNSDIITKVKDTLPDLVGSLEAIGGAMFPKVKKELRIAAAVMTAFDPDVTKWVQGSLNVLMELDPPLVVDGYYGPLTRAAVQKMQRSLGLTVDGWAGQLTQSAIQSALVARLKIGG